MAHPRRLLGTPGAALDAHRVRQRPLPGRDVFEHVGHFNEPTGPKDRSSDHDRLSVLRRARLAHDTHPAKSDDHCPGRSGTSICRRGDTTT